MVSMGYLTIKKDLDPGEESPYLHFYSCGFPNNEVERECDALFLEYISNHEDKDIEVDNSEGGSEENSVKMHEQDVDGMFIASRQLRSALNQRDMAQAVICLNTQMHSLRYDVWRNTYEVVYRSLIAAFLRVSGGARFVVEEKGNHLGRSDIEADIGNDHFVFELKRIADNHNPNATKRLAEAAHQQIIDNGYCVFRQLFSGTILKKFWPDFSATQRGSKKSIDVEYMLLYLTGGGEEICAEQLTLCDNIQDLFYAA